MRRYLYIIIGILFFSVSFIVIIRSRFTPMIFPAQEIFLQHVPDFGPVYSGNLFIQEIELKKNYIHGVDVLMGNWEPKNDNDNVICLMDSNYQMLYAKKFSSKIIWGPAFYRFNFSKSIHPVTGNKVLLCIYSLNGSINNNIALAKDPAGKLGRLYVSDLRNNDVIGSVKNKDIFFEGNLCVKTYESKFEYEKGGMAALILISLVITSFIIFIPAIKRGLVRITIIPERIYLIAAITAGVVFVFITPPLQVPDEPSHFYRSYQVSSLNIYRFNETVPASLPRLTSVFDRLAFRPFEKVRVDTIRSQAKVGLEPGKREKVSTLGYVLPFIPQALGIGIGRMLNLSPLWLLYLGRITNLLISILVIYFAIKISPVNKWIFFLLGLMPMTVFQLASLSYDAITIGLSFLLAAVLFQFAYDDSKKITTRDLVVLFIVSYMLALCKPPYYLIGVLFIIIPVKKIGSLKKYLLLYFGLLISMFIVSQLWSVSHDIFKPSEAKVSAAIPAPADDIQAKSILQENGQTPLNDTVKTPSGGIGGFNSSAQKQFILDNIPKFLGILVHTFALAWRIYLDCFVGLLGWVDTPLPGFLINSFLIILLVTSLALSNPKITIGIIPKILAFLVFSLGIIIILTGLYLYANPTGYHVVEAVQGRYFIPFAPLFLLLFYNKTISEKLNFVKNPGKKKPVKSKPSLKNIPKEVTEKPAKQYLFSKFLQLFIVFFAVVSLLYTVYIILTRYYLINI